MLVAAGVFLVLSFFLLAGWSQGSRAWRTVSERNEVLAQAQRFLRLTERELEVASSSGLETGEAPAVCLAYASTFGIAQPRDFVVDSVSGALRWQKQVVLSHDAASATMLRRQLPVPVTQPGYLNPGPISQVDLGDGLREASWYAHDGEIAARQVTQASFALEGRQVVIRLTLLTDGEREARFESTTLLRN